MYESSETEQAQQTERTERRNEFKVKMVKVDRESVIRQADVF